jgi:hypothetical protein
MNEIGAMHFFRWNLLGYIIVNLIQQMSGKILGKIAADLTKLINKDNLDA